MILGFHIERMINLKQEIFSISKNWFMGKADMIEEEPKNLIVKIYRVLDKYIKNSSLQ